MAYLRVMMGKCSADREDICGLNIAPIESPAEIIPGGPTIYVDPHTQSANVPAGSSITSSLAMLTACEEASAGGQVLPTEDLLAVNPRFHSADAADALLDVGDKEQLLQDADARSSGRQLGDHDSGGNIIRCRHEVCPNAAVFCYEGDANATYCEALKPVKASKGLTGVCQPFLWRVPIPSYGSFFSAPTSVAVVASVRQRRRYDGVSMYQVFVVTAADPKSPCICECCWIRLQALR